jgi:hypothetical protein
MFRIFSSGKVRDMSLSFASSTAFNTTDHQR